MFLQILCNAIKRQEQYHLKTRTTTTTLKTSHIIVGIYVRYYGKCNRFNQLYGVPQGQKWQNLRTCESEYLRICESEYLRIWVQSTLFIPDMYIPESLYTGRILVHSSFHMKILCLYRKFIINSSYTGSGKILRII